MPLERHEALHQIPHRAVFRVRIRIDRVRLHRPFSLAGYRDMLVKDFETIPDLRFNIGLLVCEPPHIAARLQFDCSPTHEFLGLDVGGRRIAFAENVFYEFREERIAHVWSVIDKAAIEAQLQAQRMSEPYPRVGSCNRA